MDRSTVLIIGGGIGGLTLALAVARIGRRARVLEKAQEFAEIGAGVQLAPNASHALEAVGVLDAVHTHAVFPKRIVWMDAQSGERLTALDLGPQFIERDDGVPGAHEYTFPLKTIEDAVALRAVTITALENAATSSDDAERRALTTFVVVGGGFTGVEAAGELLTFLRSAARFYPRIEHADIRVVLIAGSDRLLEQLPSSLGTLAQRMLGRCGVEVVLGDQVAAVDAGGISLRSGKRYESRCIVWSAGVRPRLRPTLLSLIRSIMRSSLTRICRLRELAPFGRSETARRFHNQTAGRIRKPRSMPFMRRTLLARNLLATLRGRKTKPYAYRARGVMASLGAREGLAEIGGRWTIAGLPGWFLWRTYYLWQLPGNDRKARVMLDWSLDFPFPQDIASVR